MKKVIIFMFLFVLIFSGCKSKIEAQEKLIQDEINNTNYCEIMQDCVMVNSKCPFGCNVYVNFRERDRIQELIDLFESNCEYKCRLSVGVECENDKCIPIFE